MNQNQICNRVNYWLQKPGYQKTLFTGAFSRGSISVFTDKLDWYCVTHFSSVWVCNLHLLAASATTSTTEKLKETENNWLPRIWDYQSINRPMKIRSKPHCHSKSWTKHLVLTLQNCSCFDYCLLENRPQFEKWINKVYQNWHLHNKCPRDRVNIISY